MDSKDLAIGTLTVTATILLVGVLIVNTVAPQAAMAFGQSARGGDYVVSTGQLDPDTELVYVVDAQSRRLNVYGFDLTSNQIQLFQGISLRGPARGDGR